MQPQTVSHIIEADGVGELGVEQTDHMAPGVNERDYLFLPMAR
jgi:hypothetical protein